MKSHLKVKVYSLSNEMTYIRRQEEKWKNRAKQARQRQKQHNDEESAKRIAYAEANFWSQRWHRAELKDDARTSHLAYGFMKGRDYSQMEFISYGGMKGRGKSVPDWADIEATVERFTKDEPEVRDIMQRFGEWLASAKVWFEGNPDRIRETVQSREAAKAARRADEAYQTQRKRIGEEARVRAEAANAA